ncbi:MAG: hypothetical protein HDKAJFGB_00805 [Anaerolineae bacterium]|nr:hypothetical protein [Anaerolineae bacterium]
MLLRDYQRDAVSELVQKTNRLLKLGTNKTIVFQAPTGSGKTVMMAEYLKALIEQRADDRRFAFIWTAPRQLHTQSFEKLAQYYFDSKALRCVTFEDLNGAQIAENEILFLNWESINKRDNIYIRENERDFNLSSVVENTRDAGRTLILCIDESHFAAKSEISRELIAMLAPQVTLEVSATPNLHGDETVTVQREQVILEEMIKKRIAINPDFENSITKHKGDETIFTSAAAESGNEIILRLALEKRAALAQAFQACGSNVNPLLLIQLPDHRQGEDDMKDEIVKLLGAKHQITEDNGKLAIYLAADKANLETITRNDSDVDVMIFKQAIALGWDCPRASILALFREWKSFTFSIQTLGRILRMPELKHYQNDELNVGYVFTNLNDLAIQNELARDYVTLQQAKRRADYQPLQLRSVYPKRFREETRLAASFVADFMQAAQELELKTRLNRSVKLPQVTILSNGIIENIDKGFKHIGEGEKGEGFSATTIERVQTTTEAQREFDHFVRDNLHPFAPEQRSIGRAKQALYEFFKQTFPKEQYTTGDIRIQLMTLIPENRQTLIDALNRAKEIYQANVGKGKRELITLDGWEIPRAYNYNQNYKRRKLKRSAFEPFYESLAASDLEQEFAMFLANECQNVAWWFKNGEQDGTFFAVPYSENEIEKPFYVDWIVKFADGRVGLFDTKSGITARDAKARAAGLARYIAQENKNGKNLFGGIVTQKDDSWRYNDRENYSYNENDLSAWKYLA